MSKDFKDRKNLPLTIVQMVIYAVALVVILTWGFNSAI